MGNLHDSKQSPRKSKRHLAGKGREASRARRVQATVL
jgi:hypothetical protein